MRHKSGLLLLVMVGAGVAVVLLLLSSLGDPEGSETALGPGRDRTGLVPDLGGPGEGPGAHLAPAPGAMTPEERALERDRAAAAARAAALADGVFGRVTDAKGSPLEGASVRLGVSTKATRTWGNREPPAIATATTNPDGYYVVGPAPSGLLRVRAEASGYAPSAEVVRRRGCRVDLILDRGGALEVTVKAAGGQVLEGADVLHMAGSVVSDTTSDENGRAFFPGLPTGTGTLIVIHADHASVRQEGVAVAPSKTERLTVVLGDPILVRGRVLDEATERPVAGARLTARGYRMPWMERTKPVTTDPDGRFEFPTTAPLGQSLEIDVTAKGYASRRQRVPVTDAGGGRMSAEIRLTAGAVMMVGEVQSQAGRPVPGVRVTYMRGSSDLPGPETETDRHGWFQIETPPWSSQRGSRIQLVAISELLGVGSAYVRIPKKDEKPEPARIRLSGVGTIRGQVTDEGGEPVSGALVTLEVDWRTLRERARQNPTGVPPWLVGQALQDPRHAPLDAVTQENGRFTIDGVPAAPFLMSGSFGLERATSPETLLVEPGDTVERDLVLGSGATIEGWVQDREGQPVPGAYVNAWPLEQGRRYRMIYARSQSDGAYVLRSIAGQTYNLRSSAAGYESKSVRNVESGSREVLLTLQPLGWISGVVSHEGRPYEGTFTVSARKVDEGGEQRSPRWRGGSHSNTFSTDDGKFVLRNLRSGAHDVTAQTTEGLITVDAVRATVTDGRETPILLTLRGGARLEGKVVDGETGAPISGAWLSVDPVPGPEAPPTTGRARTDAEGEFVVRALAGGRYMVRVVPPRDTAFYESLELGEGEAKRVRLRKRPPGSVRVTVRDEEGLPIADATPRLRVPSGFEVWPNMSRLMQEMGARSFDAVNARLLTRTDDSGVNVRQQVPPGHYEVSVTKRGWETVEPKSVTVASGRTTEVGIVLKPAADPPPGGRSGNR